MFSVLLISRHKDAFREVADRLGGLDYVCLWRALTEDIGEEVVRVSADGVVIIAEDVDTLLQTCHAIRELHEGAPLPVVVVGDHWLLDSKEVLKAADDFVVAPYEAREVVTRIERVMTHTYGLKANNVIRTGDLYIDLSRRDVKLQGERIPLTFKEYELVRLLAANRGRVLTRDTLLNKIWGYDYYGGDRTVDVHIRRLRAKIERGRYSFIDTVRGIGYRFREDP